MAVRKWTDDEIKQETDKLTMTTPEYAFERWEKVVRKCDWFRATHISEGNRLYDKIYLGIARTIWINIESEKITYLDVGTSSKKSKELVSMILDVIATFNGGKDD